MPELSDTSPDAQRVQIELMRQAPSWRKLELLGDLVATVKQLALSGLRRRHPGASEAQLRRRLAEHLLGPELATRAYGPLEDLDVGWGPPGWALQLARLQHQLDAIQDLAEASGGQGPDPFIQLRFVHGKDLGDIDHAAFGQSSLALLQKNIARRLGPAQV